MKKIYFGLCVALLTFGAQAFAQETEDSDIALPDLTTIVTGSNDVVSEETIPDFSTLIDIENVESQLLLNMGDVSLEDSGSSVFIPVAQRDKVVFAEGKIGGGFPGSFIGDFSVQQDRGENPFKIAFNHSASDGYSNNDPSTGYNDNQTLVSLNKTVNFASSDLLFGGFYEALGNGLQSKVDNISAINQRNINGFAEYEHRLAKGFSFGGNFTGDYYMRFADTSFALQSEPEDFAKWIRKYSLINLKPEAHFAWGNDSFNTGIYAAYNFDTDFVSDYVINRGEFMEKFAWQNDMIKVNTNVGVVIGNQIAQPVLVPFTVGVESSFPIYFSDRKLSVSAEGGMLSENTSVYELEKKYKFSGFSTMPGEVSDWYGKIDLSVPMKASVTVNFDADYKHTAFGNGFYEPVYNESGFTYGLYQFEKINNQRLKTNLEFVYHYKLFSTSFGWLANWLYVPALENAQTFALTLALQNELSSWGVNLSGLYSMDAVDLTPRINLEAFLQLNNAVRLVLSVEDGIKLFTLKERVYADKYISQSGNATLLVKFFF